MCQMSALSVDKGAGARSCFVVFDIADQSVPINLAPFFSPLRLKAKHQKSHGHKTRKVATRGGQRGGGGYCCWNKKQCL